MTIDKGSATRAPICVAAEAAGTSASGRMTSQKEDRSAYAALPTDEESRRRLVVLTRERRAQFGSSCRELARVRVSPHDNIELLLACRCVTVGPTRPCLSGSPTRSR
jgi:hypothetical protein